VFELQLVVRSSEIPKFLRSFMQLGVLMGYCKEFATEIKFSVRAYVVRFVLTY